MSCFITNVRANKNFLTVLSTTLATIKKYMNVLSWMCFSHSHILFSGIPMILCTQNPPPPPYEKYPHIKKIASK